MVPLLSKPLLKKIAEKVLGHSYATMLWKRIEIVGDIAVIRKPFNIDISINVFKTIGEELLKELPYVKSVWLIVSPVYGAIRVRDCVHIAGENRSETVYREHGCIFMLDITKVYFSPVLSYDHIRIAKKVKEGEKVLNMFSGFCPYSIIISKYAKPQYVISIDINEYATRYARINIELNKVAQVNEIIHGDSLLIASTLNDKFDRVLMPYPDLFEDAIIIASRVTKNNGYIHPHLFVDSSNRREALLKASEIILDRLNRINIVAKVCGGHVIRGVAPRKYHVAIDVQIINKIY